MTLLGLSPVLLRQAAIVLLNGFAIVMLWPALYARAGLALQHVGWAPRAHQRTRGHVVIPMVIRWAQVPTLR